MNPGLIAFLAGAMIALQATVNSRLGVLVGSALLGTSIAYLSGFFFVTAAYFIAARDFPTSSQIQGAPWLLWIAGGALGALALTTFYYLIPKLGVGPMMSFALSGQLLVGVVISHFGWLEFPVHPFDETRMLGVCALITGIILVNWS